MRVLAAKVIRGASSALARFIATFWLSFIDWPSSFAGISLSFYRCDFPVFEGVFRDFYSLSRDYVPIVGGYCEGPTDLCPQACHLIGFGFLGAFVRIFGVNGIQAGFSTTSSVVVVVLLLVPRGSRQTNS